MVWGSHSDSLKAINEESLNQGAQCCQRQQSNLGMEMVELWRCLNAQAKGNEGGVEENLGFQFGKLGKGDQTMEGWAWG